LLPLLCRHHGETELVVAFGLARAVPRGRPTQDGVGIAACVVPAGTGVQVAQGD
jgi:hypothetical protein